MYLLLIVLAASLSYSAEIYSATIAPFCDETGCRDALYLLANFSTNPVDSVMYTYNNGSSITVTITKPLQSIGKWANWYSFFLHTNTPYIVVLSLISRGIVYNVYEQFEASEFCDTPGYFARGACSSKTSVCCKVEENEYIVEPQHTTQAGIWCLVRGMPYQCVVNLWSTCPILTPKFSLYNIVLTTYSLVFNIDVVRNGQTHSLQVSSDFPITNAPNNTVMVRYIAAKKIGTTFINCPCYRLNCWPSPCPQLISIHCNTTVY